MPAYANHSEITVTISSGQTTSSAFNLGDNVILGFHAPTIDTGDITFTVSSNTSGQSGTYQPLKNSAGTTLPVVAGTGAAYFAVDPEAFRGVTWIKFVAASQTADRTFTVVLGKMYG